MKTQIITLESHDDLISVRDRMMWAKTARILLVWPKYENVTLRILDLKVLQRHADSLGAQLGLVTRRANVRRDAQALSIPVFESTSAAQRNVWPDRTPKIRNIPRPPRRDLRTLRESVNEKEAPWRTSPAGRVVTFTAGVLAFLAVAGLFVPRAAVTLYPESQVQSMVIPIRVSKSVSAVSLTGNLPAYETTVVVSGEQSVPVSNQILVPNSKAKGVARFTNLSQADATIPVGTILSLETDSVRFLTLHATRLPGGPDQFVDVPIEAVDAGAMGNVEAEKIVVVEGQLGLSVAVTNPEPTKGGADLKTTGATDADRARLRDVLMENLKHEAEIQMRASLAKGDIPLVDTFDISDVKNETYDPPAGQPGKSLKLTLEVEFAARYISESDLYQLTHSSLDALLPAEYVASTEPVYEPVAEPVTDEEGVTSFELSITRKLLEKINPAEVFAITRGRKPEVALDKLSSVSSRKPPEINLTPSWWPWMPLIPFNISVVMK